jgi:hypothetical protein
MDVLTAGLTVLDLVRATANLDMSGLFAGLSTPIAQNMLLMAATADFNCEAGLFEESAMLHKKFATSPDVAVLGSSFWQ